MPVTTGWITLKRRESWNEMVTASKPWPEDEAEQLNDIVSALRREIQPRIPAPFVFGGNTGVLAEGNPETVQKAVQFFEQKFKLSRGTYRLLIAALSESRRPIAVVGFEFTLYESSIRDLRAITEDYKYGRGVCF